jgi:hypothetical protein
MHSNITVLYLGYDAMSSEYAYADVSNVSPTQSKQELKFNGQPGFRDLDLLATGQLFVRKLLS